MLDKRDSVRERLSEVISEIAQHDIKLLSDEIWQRIALMALDRKEKVRSAAISTIIDTYVKYDDDTEDNKSIVLELRRNLFQIYLKINSLAQDLKDVQGKTTFLQKVLNKKLLLIGTQKFS
jgi:CII-binding regulator of phage lambda lysogenization HflD